MTANKNHDDDDDDDAFSYHRAVPWSNLNHDVLFLVMMQLEFVDFLACGGVCKSWRSVSLSNRKKFMTSIPPMSMWINDHAHTKECYCYLEDSEGRKFKTIIPNSFGRRCVGLTCGYLVLYSNETHDFRLVNPITRHELHFPTLICLPNSISKAILVFSPLINGWVFVVLYTYFSHLWFSIVGNGVWNRVPATSNILDLHAFKGKVYTLHLGWRVCELNLHPNPELALLEIKNYPKGHVNPVFISSDENLYVINFSIIRTPDNILKLIVGEMKWVSSKEKTIGEYAFFQSQLKYGAAIKPELWAAKPPLKYRRVCFLDTNDKSVKATFFVARMWYFPHDCLDVNHINE